MIIVIYMNSSRSLKKSAPHRRKVPFLPQKDSDFQRLVQSEQLHTSEEKVLHLGLYTNIKNGGRLPFKVDYL